MIHCACGFSTQRRERMRAHIAAYPEHLARMTADPEPRSTRKPDAYDLYTVGLAPIAAKPRGSVPHNR